jgi:ATPase subunit of ABC transporter with duplicated ATPase domains
MSILTVKNMNHGFGEKTIFENVSFRLLKGEHVGIVGANGEGKSTFMSIITNKLMPDEGEVIWSNKVNVGYMDQHANLQKGISIRDTLKGAFKNLFDIEESLTSKYEKMATATEEELIILLEDTANMQQMIDNSDLYMVDSKIDEVAKGIGLLEIGLDKKVDELSGGQRTKVLLCKLLLEKPDILLLDEPTNYLDAEHINWLKHYLISYENAFILISHDIPFLNDVVNIIYHINNATLTRYVGNYDEFLRVYEQTKKQVESAFNRQQSEIANLQDFIARNKARVATSGMAKARQKKLDKMDIIEISKEKPKPTFAFKYSKTPEKIIFETSDLVIGYEEPLSKPINLTMERGEKIAIIGSNGIGKTTLLKSLLSKTKPISGNVEIGRNQDIGYFAQETDQGNKNNCIDEIWEEFPGFNQYEVRAALARCGLTNKEIESKIYVLSGGEQAKVRFCKIMNRESNILILDEPTNHLDVEAKKELKKALKEYKGTILMVCHEPEFYEDLVTKVWDLTEYTLKII